MSFMYYLVDNEHFVNLNTLESMKQRYPNEPANRAAIKFAGRDMTCGDNYIITLFKDHLAVKILEGVTYEFERLSLEGIDINGDIKLWSTSLTKVISLGMGHLQEFQRRHYSFDEILDVDKIKVTSYRNYVDNTGKVAEIVTDNGTCVKLVNENGLELSVKFLGDWGYSLAKFGVFFHSSTQ